MPFQAETFQARTKLSFFKRSTRFTSDKDVQYFRLFRTKLSHRIVFQVLSKLLQVFVSTFQLYTHATSYIHQRTFLIVPTDRGTTWTLHFFLLLHFSYAFHVIKMVIDWAKFYPREKPYMPPWWHQAVLLLLLYLLQKRHC